MDTNQPKVAADIGVSTDSSMFMRYIPRLRRMTDEAMADALADLFLTGAKAGAEEAKKIAQDMGGWLARLAVAHQRKDTGEIAAILDEFIAARCVF